MGACILTLALCVFCSSAFAGETWQPVTGIKEPDIKEIAIDEGIIYVSSEKGLYRSEDNGKTWNTVFTARGNGNSINFIAVSEKGAFVCTENGLFKSDDGKTGWKKIFKGVGIEENNISHIAFSGKEEIYLGTKGGLFTSNDNGAAWQKSSGETGNISVKWIICSGEVVFLAAEKGVYKGSGPDWKRVFITSTEEVEYDVDSADEAAAAAKPVNSIFIKDKTVFLATDSGIFTSGDRGESWQRFESSGLGSNKINRILFEDNLYAATDNGVFVFNDNDNIWQALYQGIDTDRINSIAVDSKNRIFVATDKGLYRAEERLLRFAYNDSEEDNILELFSHEPTVREVQNAAIEYAEVNPNKIKSWRKRANLKALLPEFSLDYDKTITYDSGVDRYYVGPSDWGASVKWDLGELIWNQDQTSIDVRSKLMVQLRDDIIDETTRTYFERRRLQIEACISPPVDLKLKLEKDLRIQELTADLDALTGGYFSNHPK